MVLVVYAIDRTTDEQRSIAEDTIADVNASGLWPGKVVTQVVPASAFWEAEPEHDAECELLEHKNYLPPDLVLGRVSAGHAMCGWLLARGIAPDRLDALAAGTAKPDVIGIRPKSDVGIQKKLQTSPWLKSAAMRSSCASKSPGTTNLPSRGVWHS